MGGFLLAHRPRTLAALAASLALTAALVAKPSIRSERPPLQKPRWERLGVNAHVPSAEDFDAMERAGVRWARVDFTWDTVEPERGRFEWPCFDAVVEQAELHHVRLLAILGYTPPWASAWSSVHDPPRDIQEWKDFVRTIVGRYRGRVRHWTLWNEPNSRAYFTGSKSQFIHGVLIPGARAAKEADPDCRIVGPDLAHLHGADWDGWMDAILSEGGCYLDVISHHCYRDDPGAVYRELEGRKFPWEPTSVRSLLERRGQEGKPFWLTEVGWRSTSIGPARQAGNIVSFLKGLERRPWIDRVFLFELKDSPCLPGYGLLNVDGAPKPAFLALRGFLLREGEAGQR